MLEIDGSYGEGGGQILRTALALSVITRKPCYVFNIRKNRENSGLGLQHLIGIKSLAEICNAKIEGDTLGSSEIIFEPGEILKKEIEVKIETAASITLILQMLTLAFLFSKERIKIKFKGGATDTFFSPTIDYFRYVFLSFLEKIISKLPRAGKGEVRIDIEKRGFYPKGGAEVEVEIFPFEVFQKLDKKLELKERGNLKRILIISGASESLRERKVAERQLNGLHQTPLFYKKAHLPIETKIEYYDSFSDGSQITIIGEFENSILGASALGRLGKSSEEVGKEAGMEFLKEIRENAVIDSHLADQILPYIALLAPEAEIKTSFISLHTKTNAWVIEKFLKEKIEFDKNLIKCYSNYK